MRLSPPYPTIRRLLNEGKVIPFLGAGASFGARNPGKTPWRTRVQAAQNAWTVSFLPTANELAKYLATEAAFPDDETVELAKVAQYYSTIIGRSVLYQDLHQIFMFKQQPAALHHYLAEVAQQSPLLIVTTNYDTLIEHAFDAAGRAYDVVAHATNPAQDGEILWWPHGQHQPQELLAKDLDIDLTAVTVIYKMHGTIDRHQHQRGQYVITEDDYIDFLTRMTTNSAIPKIFAEPFQTRHFLFLGYGLYDWNLRVVLNRIEKELRRPGDIQSWAIEPRSKQLEKMLWNKRNVTMFDELTLDDFIVNLKAPPKRASKKGSGKRPTATLQEASQASMTSEGTLDGL